MTFVNSSLNTVFELSILMMFLKSTHRKHLEDHFHHTACYVSTNYYSLQPKQKINKKLPSEQEIANKHQRAGVRVRHVGKTSSVYLSASACTALALQLHVNSPDVLTITQMSGKLPSGEREGEAKLAGCIQ